MFGLLVLVAAFPAPVHAQGQGGYAPGCPGAETARMSSEERARARGASDKRHQWRPFLHR